MSLPPFGLLRPTTLLEALEAMAEAPGIVPLAGGTSLLVDLRDRRSEAELLVDLSKLKELQGIETTPNEIVLGATTTIAELLHSPFLRQCVPLLTECCRTFAAPLIRNRATIGGNLAYASPAADCAPSLLALDASVELRSLRDKRLIPLSEFFLGVRRTVVRPGELLTAVVLPRSSAGGRAAYRKLGLRKANAISVGSVAVRVTLDQNNRCNRVRIALGAVAPTPRRAESSESHLVGKRLTETSINEAAHLASRECAPIDDVRGSATYRRRTTETLVRRCLLEIAEISEAE